MQTRLYRKRLIPLENILLKDDRILFRDSHSMITSWTTLKPKAVLASGVSLYLFEEGLKISRHYDHEGNFMYWYCDIIDTSYEEASDTYVFSDLLIDVEIYPDGSYHILDLDEFSDAFREGLLEKEQLLIALKQLDNLLSMIYDHRFDQLVQPLLSCKPSF